MASIKKLDSGWQFRVSYKDDAGKYKVKTENGYRTKKDAEAAAHNLELMLKSGLRLDAGKIPFVDYFKKWFSLYKQDSVSEKTGTHYQQTADHIKVYFGKMPIGDITEDMYQAFLKQFGKTHAKETAAKLNVHCKSCVKRAVKMGVISKDFTDDAIVTGEVAPKQEKTKYINQDGLVKLITAVLDRMSPADASRHIILFSLVTGVRFSEALGLTWDCIDFDNKTVRINKTWDSSKNDFGPTKNEASNRLITIDQQTLDILKDYHKAQLKRHIGHKKNLVFLTFMSEVPTNNSVNTSLKRAIQRAGISPIITHHGLRHTHVSLLLHEKVNIKYISRRIGHASVSTTYDKYAHIIDEMEQVESLLTTQTIDGLYQQASAK